MTLKDLLIRMAESYSTKGTAITFRYDAECQIFSFECEYDGAARKGQRWVMNNLYQYTSDVEIDWEVSAAFNSARSLSFQENVAQP